MQPVPAWVQAALKQVRQALMALYGDQLSSIYLYGSYARGDFRADSDVDLMIALKGDVNPAREVQRLNPALSAICLRYDVLISTYPVPERWLTERHGPLFVNVRHEGIRL